MNIYDSKLWISDLDETINILSDLSKLSNKSVMITGCTGLICSALIDVLIRWNIVNNEKIRIIAAGRCVDKIQRRFAPYSNKEWFVIIPYNAFSVENSIDIKCDYIIHGASNASPSKIVNEPVETMLSNFIGVNYWLEYARKKAIKRVLFISTSEVYGRNNLKEPSREDDYGWIDLLNSRNSYSIGKCAAETLCASYYDEYGVSSVIIRPGHIYGPTALNSDNRISSLWAFSAARGENIIMKSNGTQMRSYCYCLDCVSAIIKVLIKGDNCSAYNVSNPNSVMSIKDMAGIFARIASVKLEIEEPTEGDKKSFNPMSNSSLDSTKLIDLDWKAIFDAEKGISHTVNVLRELSNYVREQ